MMSITSASRIKLKLFGLKIHYVNFFGWNISWSVNILSITYLKTWCESVFSKDLPQSLDLTCTQCAAQYNTFILNMESFSRYCR